MFLLVILQLLITLFQLRTTLVIDFILNRNMLLLVIMLIEHIITLTVVVEMILSFVSKFCIIIHNVHISNN